MMDDTARPTLLLTRPSAASERFLTALEARMNQRIPAVISPVMRILPAAQMPEPLPQETIILTSSNAASIAGEAGLLRGKDCLTVGEKTAATALTAGGQAACIGHSVETFLSAAQALTPRPALHLRGTHTTGGLSASLAQYGWRVREEIIYDQLAQPLSKAAQRLVAEPGRVILPLFSPRSATLTSGLGPVRADLVVIAMSQAVAAAWAGPGQLLVLNIPSAEAMIERIEREFRLS